MVKRTSKSQTTWRIRIITMLLGWAIAFIIVYIILTLFGEQLESLPTALDALIFTGILVPIMGNLVMPHLSAAVAHRVNKNRQ